MLSHLSYLTDHQPCFYFSVSAESTPAPKKSLFASMCGCLGGKPPVEEKVKEAETAKEDIAEAAAKEPVEEATPAET